MANFLASLRSTATTLEMLQRSVSAGQNNVLNASTPGYAKQRIALKALDFNPEGGLTGGVTTAGMTSSRDRFAEAAVQAQVSALGAAEQSKIQLSWVQSAVDMNDKAGIPSALNRMFSAFTAWSLAPSSMAEKENVYAAAHAVAESFNHTADLLGRTGHEAGEQVETTLASINNLAERVRQYNDDRRNGGAPDGGADARIHSDLEQLSSLLNIQALWQEDGTVTLLAGGRAPLVVGQNRYELSYTIGSSVSNPIPPIRIVDAGGNDLTSAMTSGKLGALLEFRNETLPWYLGDGTSPGQLNVLADKVKERVNTFIKEGSPLDLFSTPDAPGWSAYKLQVNPDIKPADLTASDGVQANGIPLKLAALSRPTSEDDMIGGLTFIGFFGKIAADAGRRFAEAKESRDSRDSLVAQARNMRSEISAVSLDEEAIRLVEYQRAYQAAARMMSALNELTGLAVNIGRN